MEIWKDITGYEGLYQVSSTGRVRRLFKNKVNVLKGRMTQDGYRGVILSKHQVKKHCRVHRLVAEEFIANPENKPQVNHKDRNKLNNNVSNLEWVTACENTEHCILTGRKAHTREILQYTREMEYVASWDSIREASKSLKISPNNICSCCRGQLETSGGYIWRYKEAK